MFHYLFTVHNMLVLVGVGMVAMTIWIVWCTLKHDH